MVKKYQYIGPERNVFKFLLVFLKIYFMKNIGLFFSLSLGALRFY